MGAWFQPHPQLVTVLCRHSGWCPEGVSLSHCRSAGGGKVEPAQLLQMRPLPLPSLCEVGGVASDLSWARAQFTQSPGFSPQHRVNSSDGWYMPIIPAVRSWRQEDQKYEIIFHKRSGVQEEPRLHQTPISETKGKDCLAF